MTHKWSSLAVLVPGLLHIFLLTASAKTIRVPLDEPTIQAAIDTADDDDVIMVSPGTYFENIDFLGKTVKVKSKDGAKKTIIDGSSNGPVVIFASGEGRASILSGFTIRNGRSGFDTPGDGGGGGVFITLASPTIKNNIIRRNRACYGAGIVIGSGMPVIQGNLITGNSQAGCGGGTGGGGIGIVGIGAAQILDNVITNNFIDSSDGGGISLFDAGAPTIRGNIIQGNTATGLSNGSSGGGISMVNQSDAIIVQNLITGNSAGYGGGIYWLVPSGDRGPFLFNNTISDNLSPNGSGVFADGFDAHSRLINNLIVASAGEAALSCGDFNDHNPPVIRFNDIFSPSGAAYSGSCTDRTGIDGNISADPLFVSVVKQNYHVRRRSPAVDAGDSEGPSLTALDFDGARRIQDGDLDGIAVVDMGAYELTPFVATRDRRQSAVLTDLFLSDDDSDDLPPVASSQALFRSQIHEISSDNRVRVFTYDAAGRLITHTDASGRKEYTPQGKTGSK